jgi:hypothetical protein
MSGLRDTVNRTNPTANYPTTTYFGIMKYPSLVDADLNSGAGGPINTERVSLQWGPLSFGKIANAATATVDYPCETLDGISGGTAVTVSSSSGATVTLSGSMTWDPTGLLLMFVDVSVNANDYTWYRIIAQPSATTLTLNRAPAAIGATQAFKFLIDCENLNALFVKTEYSVSGATCDLIPAFYDTGRTPAGTPAVRAPMRFTSGIISPSNNGDNTDSTQGSYYHGDAVSVNCAGATGAKIRLHTAPTSGNVSIWACAS